MTNRLLCMILAAALTALTVTGCGAKTADEYVAKAAGFIAQGDVEAATIELKNALQVDANSGQARWLLGKLYLDGGDILGAEKELLQARKMGYDSNSVYPLLAESLLLQGKFPALREIKYSALTNKSKARVLSSKALGELAQGEQEEASRLVSLALLADPESVQARLVKSRLAAYDGDTEQAMATLDGILDSDPTNARAWSLRGDILGQQDPEGAITAYSKAIEHSTNFFSDLVKRGMLNLEQGDLDAAGSDANALIAAAPRHPAGNYIQGLLFFQQEKYDEAISSLSLAEPAARQFPMVLFYLGSAHLLMGNSDQAAAFASHFFAVAPGNIAGRKLLATIRLQRGQFDDVIELMDPVVEVAPDDIGALNLLANARLRSGDTDAGITLLAKVAELEPDSAAAQVRLGAGMLLGNQGDEAQEHIQAALELNPEFQQADILLVLNEMQRGNVETAIENAKAYRRRNPGIVTPYNLLGRVYLSAQRPDEARESFGKALQLDIGDPAANHNLAQLALADGDMALGRRYYLTILETHQDFLPALLQLAAIASREGETEAMMGYLERAADAHPQALQPRLTIARYYLSKNQAENVAPLFNGLSKVQQNQPQVLQIMAMAQLSSDEHEEAEATLEKLARESGETPAGLHMRAMAAAGQNDAADTRKSLEDALALNPEYLPSRIAMARLSLAERKADEFDKHLAKLIELAPDNPDVLQLRATAAQRAADLEGALGYARRSHELAPQSSSAVSLAYYLEINDGRESAWLLLQEWNDKHPDDVPTRMSLANSFQSAEANDRASQLYSEVLTLDADNVVALNNQAWHLRRTDPEEALSFARRAAELAPRAPAVLDTLAVVEYVNKEFAQAKRSIERALLGAPEDPSMRFHSAMIDVALNDRQKARATLERLLGEDTAFPEKAQAQVLLAELR